MSYDAPRFEQDMTEADFIVAQEEYELQQMIASMEQASDAKSQHYGSDDDDYDSIFMECVATVEEQYQQESQQSVVFEDADAMDMDMTDG